MSIEDRDWYRESYKQKHSGGRGSRGSGQKIAPAVLILLIAYGIFIYTFYFPGNHSFFVPENGTGLLRPYRDFLYNKDWEILKNLCFQMIWMMPVGFLVPIVRERKCRNFTLTVSLLICLFFEALKYYKGIGYACLDDVLLGMLGAYLGYTLFTSVCHWLPGAVKYIWRYDAGRHTWIIFLIAVIVGSICLDYNSSGQLGETIAEGTEAVKKQLITAEESDQQSSGSVYDKMYTAVKNHRLTVEFTGTIADLNADEIGDEYKRMMREHPEFFWLSGRASVQGSIMAVITSYSIRMDSIVPMEEVPAMESELQAETDRIIQGASQYETEYERALYVHDYIVQNCEYDTESYYFVSSTDAQLGKSLPFTSYGCLIQKNAVCEGYAEAFKLIMDQLGIDCEVITGTTVNDLGSGSHAWNSVILDGWKMYVDVTWDDPVVIGEGFCDSIRRDYFGLTETEISQDHFPDQT